MRPRLVLLLDISVLLSLGVRDKLDLARRIAELLGSEFEPLEELVGPIGLPGLVHVPTGAPFVIPPTGRYEMGFTDRDREALRAAVKTDWVGAFADELVRTSRPVRAVRVKPFVVSVRPLKLDEVGKIQLGRSPADTFLRADAIHFVESTGCRLPSEAELEWLAREGGRHSFAVDGFSAYARDGAYPEHGEWGLERLTRGGVGRRRLARRLSRRARRLFSLAARRSTRNLPRILAVRRGRGSERGRARSRLQPRPEPRQLLGERRRAPHGAAGARHPRRLKVKQARARERAIGACARGPSDSRRARRRLGPRGDTAPRPRDGSERTPARRRAPTTASRGFLRSRGSSASHPSGCDEARSTPGAGTRSRRDRASGGSRARRPRRPRAPLANARRARPHESFELEELARQLLLELRPGPAEQDRADPLAL